MAINVGDLVRITDRTENYSFYRDMFIRLGFRDIEARDSPYSNGDVLRVFSSISRPDGRATLYGLRPVEGGQEILMNNQGVEYLFPGNWHIIVTEENNEMLSNWRPSGTIHALGGIILSEHHGARGWWIGTPQLIPDHCQIEITTEQFRQYVLNQPPTDMPTQEQTQEEAFVLPDKWQIQITPDNAYMLEVWRGLNIISRDDDAFMLCDVPDGSHASVTRGFVSTTKRQDYTEITTEQFKQHVLNQTDTNMPQELTPEQQYQAANDAMNLQPGDIVRVTQRLPSYSLGWNNAWAEDMDNYIGDEYEVRRVNERLGVVFKDHSFDFPIYSLELVRRAGDHIPTPQPTSNLENEQEEAVVTTTDKVICITDKWNYVNLGEVYEVIKRDEYYTYVKDNVNGESRYAHHYFEEWVDAETKAKRDSFKALFGDHSGNMFEHSGDDVQKLLSELYPKLYTYTGWLKLKKDSNHDSKWLFDNQSIRLMSEEDSSYERIQGALRFDPDDYTHEVFNHQGCTYIRFKRNR
jgi:hypothetical protein